MLQGVTIVGPKGEPGSSFFAELEELMAVEGSGEDIEDIFTRVPALELVRGQKGNRVEIGRVQRGNRVEIGRAQRGNRVEIGRAQR